MGFGNLTPWFDPQVADFPYGMKPCWLRVPADSSHVPDLGGAMDNLANISLTGLQCELHDQMGGLLPAHFFWPNAFTPTQTLRADTAHDGLARNR
jgi:hypothetical protein